MRTDRLVERVRDVVVLLLVELLQDLVAVLELLRGTIEFAALDLPVFLRCFGIREIFGRRGMYFPFWTADGLRVGASDDRNRGRRATDSRLGFLGDDGYYWRGRSWWCDYLFRCRRLGLLLKKKSIIPNADNKGTKQHTSVAGGRCFSCLFNTSSIRFPITDTRWSDPLNKQEFKTMRRTSATNSSGLL